MLLLLCLDRTGGGGGPCAAPRQRHVEEGETRTYHRGTAPAPGSGLMTTARSNYASQRSPAGGFFPWATGTHVRGARAGGAVRPGARSRTASFPGRPRAGRRVLCRVTDPTPSVFHQPPALGLSLARWLFWRVFSDAESRRWMSTMPFYRLSSLSANTATFGAHGRAER